MGAGSSDPSAPEPSERLIDRVFERFEAHHHAMANRVIQFIALPVLMWSGLALARTLPQPAFLAAIPGVDWAVAAGLIISGGYAVLSWRIGASMAVVCLIMLVIAAYYGGNEALPLWQPALVFLALGTVIWLFGRRIEGRPRLISEMAFDLLIGPAWLIGKVLRLLRIGY